MRVVYPPPRNSIVWALSHVPIVHRQTLIAFLQELFISGTFHLHYRSNAHHKFAQVFMFYHMLIQPLISQITPFRLFDELVISNSSANFCSVSHDSTSTLQSLEYDRNFGHPNQSNGPVVVVVSDLPTMLVFPLTRIHKSTLHLRTSFYKVQKLMHTTTRILHLSNNFLHPYEIN